MPMKRNRKTKSNLRRTIQRVIDKNLEKKFHTTQLTNQLVPNTGQRYNLSQVSTGDSQQTRTGNQCRITGMYGQFTILPNQATIIANPLVYVYVVRVIIYIPKDPSVVLSGISVSSTIDKDQYTVMKDKLYPVTFANGGYSPVYKQSFKYKGSPGMVTQYSGISSSQVVKNPVRMYIVSDASLPSEQPLMSGYLKVFYTDA